MVASSTARSSAASAPSTSSKGKSALKSALVGGTTGSKEGPSLAGEHDDAMAGADDDDDLLIGSSTSKPVASTAGMDVDVGATTTAAASSSSSSSRPSFAPMSRSAQSAAAAASSAEAVKRGQLRKIPIPPHRMTPLKNDWPKLYTPLVEQAGLQVRMNVPRRCVEIRSSKHTTEVGLLQKGADFVKAYALGFEADDAIALLRMDDLFVDTFEIKDVKTLQGDHLSRAIGRLAGKDGRTRFAIENSSRTRIVLADTKIHILGSFNNIKIARDACVSLIMGSPPGKVYAHLKTISARQRQRA
ncbi:unnamed protein product [Parajaminaea phylloscopi]